MIDTKDALLAGLAGALGLERPASAAAWDGRMRAGLDPEVYAEFLEYRMGCSAGPGPGAPATFYELSGRHPALALLLLEGRLGYHEAALPPVAEAVAAGPHRIVADLGCNAGLTTLYLARRFPDASVVGIDRSAGLVEVARDLKRRAGVTNAEFVSGDYVLHDFGRPFDAAVSLQSMPAYFMPFAPSERPESYRRGRRLDALAADPVLPHRRVGERLAAVRRILGGGGRAVLQERVREVPRVLLFARLAAAAGLSPVSMRWLSWESANEVTPGRHSGPLLVAEARTPPAEFVEDRVLDLLYPPAGALPEAPAPGSGQVAVVTGALAQQTYHALAPTGRTLCVRAAMRDGRLRHVHLGLVEGVAAYSYSCDTHDSRELRLADVRQARQVFAAAAQAIAQGVRSGEVVELEPGVDQLAAAISSLGIS